MTTIKKYKRKSRVVEYTPKTKTVTNVMLYNKYIKNWGEYPDIDIVLKKRKGILFGESE